MTRLLGGGLTGVLLGRTEFTILLLGGTFTGVLLVKVKPSDEELKKKMKNIIADENSVQ